MTIKEYDKEVGDAICLIIAEGKSLVKACKEKDVEYKHIFKWIADNDEFRDNYARAREAQADYLADSVMDVADDSSIPSDDKRIRVDARKWYAGKLKPKKYGERQTVDVDVTSKGESIAAVSRLGELAAKINNVPKD